NTANVTANLKDGYSTESEVSVNGYKGYAESVKWTDSEFLFDSNWMFENGSPIDFTPKYA
ncbi:phage tail family protein, partial [Staphylococcus aureus]